MRRSWLKLGLVAALAAGGGCKSTPEAAYPKDPLFASKKPVENSTNSAPPVLYTARTPAPPVLPTTALAGKDKQKAGREDVPVTGPRGPVLATPAIRKLPHRFLQVSPVSHFASAPDQSWLQGSLEKHYAGYFELRYGDATVDARGGKVRLEDDACLVPFQDGDIVRVEGRLVPELDGARAKSWDAYPAYRLRAIQLLQRAG